MSTNRREVVPGKRVMRWFNEDRYLLANPDVAKAVNAGNVPSGRVHYERLGCAEGRDLGLLTRRERLLRGVDVKKARGLEIGPLMTPIVSKNEGSILYVDHADTQALRIKYSGDANVDIDRIVSVDVVWTNECLSEILRPRLPVDYIIASHVIEHVPDMIWWLNQLKEALLSSGTIILAIPDKRYTFDVLRTETRLHNILDAFMTNPKVPTPHMVLDHCVHFRHADPRSAWLESQDISSLRALFSREEYLEIARRSLRGEYLDVHCWVFTPRSFAAAMEEACLMGLINLACANFNFAQPFENEFQVQLVPSADLGRSVESWKRMKQNADDFECS